jgi:hypothetical protein
MACTRGMNVAVRHRVGRTEPVECPLRHSPNPNAMTALPRRLAAVLAACVAFALPANATSYSIDFTDLWWNSPDASESGWGVNVVQQSEILFVTFFLYGPDNTARWYVASSVAPTPTPNPAGTLRFSGTLYQTTGPWFGTNFNPADVRVSTVGTVTLTFNSPDTGTLAYTIGTTTVVKAIMRQGFRTNSVAGTYIGGMFVTGSSCNPSVYNGATNLLGAMTVTQAVGQIAFKVDFQVDSATNGSCTFAGAYAQNGRMANVSQGNFSCTPVSALPNAGTFTMTALDAQRNGFHASITARDQYCTYDGHFGGTRDSTN